MTPLTAEILSSIALALGIIGAIFNCKRLVICFVIWGIANGCSLIVHATTGLIILACRDIVFTGFCVWGWFNWRRLARNAIPY